MEPLVVSIAEACCILGIGRTKIYELIASKEIPIIKVGNRTLPTVAGLRTYVEAKAREAA
jgi:excisionase family DNA binding protein